MFGSEILEVAIGLVLVYLMLALVCSAISEWIARMFAMRSKTLKAGIRNLLDDPSGRTDLANKIYGHPLVKGLYLKGRWDRLKDWLWGFSSNEGPSNIPARTFVLALFDTIADGDGDEGGSDQPTAARTRPKNPFDALMIGVETDRVPKELRRMLRTILQSADSETERWEDALVKARTSVESWFDDTMDRVSGWYKRKTQLIVLGLALAVTLAMNADTFVIANSLWHDNAARDVVVAAAESRTQQATEGKSGSAPDLAELQKQIDELPLPLGWVSEGKDDPRAAPDDAIGWVVKLLGIAFTAFAVSLGAPFWFDLLNRFVNLRGSGATPLKSSGTSTSG